MGVENQVCVVCLGGAGIRIYRDSAQNGNNLYDVFL